MNLDQTEILISGWVRIFGLQYAIRSAAESY